MMVVYNTNSPFAADNTNHFFDTAQFMRLFEKTVGGSFLSAQSSLQELQF